MYRLFLREVFLTRFNCLTAQIVWPIKEFQFGIFGYINTINLTFSLPVFAGVTHFLPLHNSCSFANMVHLNPSGTRALSLIVPIKSVSIIKRSCG